MTSHFILFYFAVAIASASRLLSADLATNAWPKRLQSLPGKLPVTMIVGGSSVKLAEPASEEMRARGGTGGPMIEFTVTDNQTKKSLTFNAQSVGASVLELWDGFPQFEIWGRGGGGYWTRSLYRVVRGHYQAVRHDEFEEWPRHQNEKAGTLVPPFSPLDKDGESGGRLYFVKTRLPKP